MTTIDLAEHPELATLDALLLRGESIQIVRRGRFLGRLAEPAGERAMSDDMARFRASLGTASYPGNSVVDDRNEGDR